jgi:RES domain-containing protein
LLIVPSVVTGGRDTNVVVNPDHPHATRIAIGTEQPVHLDPRFFG